jgi:hypothetical protein
MTAHRIVVALDARTRPGDLEAAAALAGGIGAELLGLFIEDQDLLHFASLPFAHEIGHASAARRKLDVAAIERDLRARAREAERRLAGVAARIRVPSAFRVARGAAHAELLSAAAAKAASDVLQLLLLGDGESAATRWAEEARSRVAQSTLARRLDVVLAADLDELGVALQAGAPGVVVLLLDPAVLSRAELHEVLRATQAPVLLVPAAQFR